LLIFFLAAGGSQRAWTALLAVLGSAAALVVVLIFDLQGSKDMTRITTEYTFDRAVPQIRQWMYARSLGDRYAIEVLANHTALRADPSIFDGDLGKLTRDMILFSLTAYLETRQRDWLMEEEDYRSSLGTITTWRFKSDPENTGMCTKILPDDIRQMLTNAKNVFAETKPVVLVPYFCLPPRSSIRVDQTSVTLTNPFYTISFFVTEPGVVQLSMMQAGSHTMDVPTLPDRNPRFQTRLIALQVTRKLSWITAQHRNFSKYEKWSKAVVDGARAWFETKTTDESGPPWFGDDGEGDGGMFWSGTIPGLGQVVIRGGTIIHQSSQ
jgi:hypothetical protein